MLWALQQKKEADELRSEADAARQEALENLSLAKRNQAIADSLAGVAQDSALAARMQRDSTQAALQLADEERQRADAQARRAQLALAEVQRTSARIVDNILEDAAEDIRRLEYEEALRKMYNARDLKVSGKEKDIADDLLEIAFFYGETGRHERAWNILDSALMLATSSRAGTLSGPDTLSWLREQMKEFDADRFAELNLRYYPDMVLVPGGTFEMGCKEGRDIDCRGDETLHTVELDSFRIARTETTVWQYAVFVHVTGIDFFEEETPGWGWLGDNPVIRVSWFDAIVYANWVSKQLGLKTIYQLDGIPSDPNDLYNEDIEWHSLVNWSAKGFRLPTESEWEYAARGGQQSRGFPYAGSENVDEVAWYDDNSESRTHQVKEKNANELGLNDMSGNVWEWCWDWYGDYPAGPVKNPTGPEGGDRRVLRGGSWYDFCYYCRVSVRDNSYPYDRGNGGGFRLVQGLPSGL